MNKKILIAISFCLVATLVISPVLAPPGNNLLELVKDINAKVNTIITDLANLNQKLWSDSDSVKNDTTKVKAYKLGHLFGELVIDCGKSFSRSNYIALKS